MTSYQLSMPQKLYFAVQVDLWPIWPPDTHCEISEQDIMLIQYKNTTGFYARQHSYSAYMPWQFRPSICLSVRLSHRWISQKRLKLGSRSFHHTVAPSL